MHSPRTFFALLWLPTALWAQSEPGEPPAPPPASLLPEAAPVEAARELAVKQEELGKISQEIGKIQTQAEAAEEVKTCREKYRDTLQSEMVRTAPNLEADIERQAQLVSELTAPPAAGKDDAPATEEQQQKLAEYRTLHARLAPVEEGVRDVPAVRDARKQYYDKLVAEMQRIEPRTEELLAKHRELVAVVRELAAQAQTG